MNFFQAVILSAVEGITEFLPISSTGHLILASKLLNIPHSGLLTTYEIVIQLGAVLAVTTLYSKKLLSSMDLIKKLIVAFVPAAIVGFTLYPVIKNVLLGSSQITLQALFWGGIALIVAEIILKNKKPVTENVESVSYKQAFLIGAFQSVSVIPGVSRAAATIFGGLTTGLNRTTAAEFSFLLAIPTMFAASGLDIWKSRGEITEGWILTLFAGTVLSFIFALISVKFLISYIKKHDFKIFGVYRIILALIFWLFAT
jgi:undecaprenyl-diphosphatase